MLPAHEHGVGPAAQELGVVYSGGSGVRMHCSRAGEGAGKGGIGGRGPPLVPWEPVGLGAEAVWPSDTIPAHGVAGPRTNPRNHPLLVCYSVCVLDHLVRHST